MLQAREEAGKGRASVLAHAERMLNRAPPAVAVYQRLAECWPKHAFWEEIGILRAMGVSSKRIFLLFIWKHVSIGVLGGIFGLVAGGAVGLLIPGRDMDIPVNFFSPFSFWLIISLYRPARTYW